jgi:hypothetical protein
MVAAAAKACGVAAVFSRYPGGRLLALIGGNTIDGVVLLSFSPERLSATAYPMKGDATDPDFRISSLSYAFYVRVDSNVVWDGKAITGLVRPIGPNLGWSVVDDLAEMARPAPGSGPMHVAIDRRQAGERPHRPTRALSRRPELSPAGRRRQQSAAKIIVETLDTATSIHKNSIPLARSAQALSGRIGSRLAPFL